MGKTGKLLAALVILSAGILLPMHTDAKEVKVQTEVLEHRFFDGKHINNYNVHVFEKAYSRGSVSFYRGLTVMRGQGWRTVNGDHRSSKAFGLGPAFMARWEKPIGGKWKGALEGSGALLAYNHAFPYGGRAFGFQWRAGARLIYDFNDRNSLSLGYIWSHSSNGMKDRNPGYNTVGFSLGYSHSW